MAAEFYSRGSCGLQSGYDFVCGGMSLEMIYSNTVLCDDDFSGSFLDLERLLDVCPTLAGIFLPSLTAERL